MNLCQGYRHDKYMRVTSFLYIYKGGGGNNPLVKRKRKFNISGDMVTNYTDFMLKKQPQQEQKTSNHLKIQNLKT